MTAPLAIIAAGLSASGLAGAAATGGSWGDPAFLIELLTSVTGLLTGVASLVMVFRRERDDHREPPEVIVINTSQEKQ